MFLFLAIDDSNRRSFTFQRKSVERILLFLRKGDISSHVETVKSEIVLEVVLDHDLLPETEDSAVFSQSNYLFLPIVCYDDVDVA